MIKKASIRRIIIASFAFLLVILTVHIFPKNEINIKSKTIYKKAQTKAIYLIDKNDYVARSTINIDSSDKEKIAEELITALINGSQKNKYLPEGFSSYISSEAIINNINIEGDIITIDFNDKLFDNNIIHEEKIIESIVYTLTEIDGINKVSLLINGNKLNKLPLSGKIIPDYLTREIGINHKSKINNFKETQDVTIYLKSTYNDYNYFVPVTFTTNSDKEKIEIIVKELTGSDFIDSNLSSYIAAGTILKNYQIIEDEISLDFNNIIFNGFNDIDEEVIYGIALSINDTYNIKNVNFIVEGQLVKTYSLKNSWKFFKHSI